MIFKRNSGSYLSWKEYMRKITKKQPLKFITEQPLKFIRTTKAKQRAKTIVVENHWYKREGILNTDLSLETISRIFSEQLRRLPMEGRW